MKAHISQWKKSGLTQVAYCNENAIKPHIFSYYKKKFSSPIPSAKQVTPLVPVKLVTENMQGCSRLFSSSSVTKVTHTNGFSLEIHADTELSLLKPLLELLRSVS